MTTAASLKKVRDEQLLLVETARLQRMKAAQQFTELWESQVVEPGGVVDRNEALWDGAGMSAIHELDPRQARQSLATDRKEGDNFPIWRTETEHAAIRGVCRVLSDIDEVAISAAENLVNYSIGEGLAYSVVSKDKAPSAATKAAVAEVRGALDRFLEKNKLEREQDREEFSRLHRDGEDLVTLSREPVPSARLVDPSFLKEPDRPRALEDHVGHQADALTWKYGLATSFTDTTKAKYAFISWYGDPLEWNCYPERQYVHTKVNVDSEVKRGLSSFYPVWKNLLHAGRLLNNTAIGSEIQASIAYIRQHAKTTGNDEIENFVATAGAAAQIRKANGGTRTVYERTTRPGMVVDIPHGAEYKAGPLGSLNETTYLEVVQAMLRMVGTRFQQPEYMISGDASNGNYSSTLVAEAPFTKAAQARQALFCSKRKELIWKALAIMCQFGVVTIPFKVLKETMEVTVEGPEVAVRDLLEAHTIRKEEYEAGARSMQSWRDDAGLDHEEEERRRGLAPGEQAQGSLPTEPGQEAQAAPDAEGTASVQSDADQQSQELANRTKLAYQVIALVTAVSQGTVPRDSALHQLTTIFGFSQADAEALIGSAQPVEQPSPQAPGLPTPAQVQEMWATYP
jgi:hypothetical protein